MLLLHGYQPHLFFVVVLLDSDNNNIIQFNIDFYLKDNRTNNTMLLK